jgi:hypothetical protein
MNVKENTAQLTEDKMLWYRHMERTGRCSQKQPVWWFRTRMQGRGDQQLKSMFKNRKREFDGPDLLTDNCRISDNSKTLGGTDKTQQY